MILGHEAVALTASVLMHVTWNLIARHQPREAEPLWWVLLGHLVLLGPWGAYGLWSQARWDLGLCLLMAASAVANMVYFQGLNRAYAHAPVALVYPLVRSSPLLIAAWSVLFLGERLTGLAWLGIVVGVAGLLVLAHSARDRDEARALPWTLLAMLGTSVYSLTDKAATARIDGFAGLVGFLSVGCLAAWLLMSWQLRRRTGRWTPGTRLSWAPWLAGSLCIGPAYAFVIHAMRTLPAAEVVAYSNAGIVLATLLSIGVFGERQRWRQRLSAAGVICAGLVCLGVGRALGAV
jgi:phosphonate utilization associated putative membrane protein